jgi:hypothetical protein
MTGEERQRESLAAISPRAFISTSHCSHESRERQELVASTLQAHGSTHQFNTTRATGDRPRVCEEVTYDTDHVGGFLLIIECPTSKTADAVRMRWWENEQRMTVNVMAGKSGHSDAPPSSVGRGCSGG